MKKRLLITSIVMMLVVAVALSTATYAWFTSNASVTSEAVTLTAASNNAASLGIGWTETGSFGPSITPESPASPTTFAPALPNELTNETTKIQKTGDAGAHEIAFATEFATPNASGDMVFLGNGSSTTPYNWNNGTEQSFFIKNLSPASTISTVTLTATITGDAAALLRVGVFKFNESSGAYELQGVLANTTDYTYTVVATDTSMSGANGTYFKKYLGQYVAAVAGTAAQVTEGSADYEQGVTTAPAGKFYTRSAETTNHAEVAYGTITQNNSVNAMTTTYCVESIVVATGLEALHTEEFKVLVWEDAVALGDTEQGFVGSVALTFTAGAASVPND